MEHKRPKVIVSSTADPEDLRSLSLRADVVINPSSEPWTREQLLAHAADAFGWLAFMTDAVDSDLLECCPALRVIAGALKGCDNFDVEACTRRGVWLTVVPDLLTAPTADLAVGLLLALSRNLIEGDRLMRTGKFRGWRPVLYGVGIEGATVGLLGMGALGQAIAARLRGFGCRLLYFDERPLPAGRERELNAGDASLQDIRSESDIIMLALSLTPGSVHIVDRRFLAQVKPGCLLINPARGSLVDEEAVADAIETGALAGYAADVFALEDIARPARPRAIPSRLLADTRRTVLTPHIGSAVAEVRRQIVAEAAANILDCLDGRRPRGAVNNVLTQARSTR